MDKIGIWIVGIAVELIKKAETIEEVSLILLCFGVILLLIIAFYLKLKRRHLLKRRRLLSFFLSKLGEFSDLLFKGKDIEIQLDDKYNCFTLHEHCKRDISSRNEKFSKIIVSLKEFICHHQGTLADYSYTTGVLHKNLKLAYKGGADADTLKPLAKNLFTTALRNMKEQFKNADVFLTKSFFKSRSNHNIRMAVRALDDVRMVDIYRCKSEYYSEFDASMNSGFDHVKRTGRFFICNDIPKEAAADNYKNPRLDNAKVRRYLEYACKNTGDVVEEWIKCWKENENKEDGTTRKPSPESCYKSTLIIPMTLLGNTGLSEEFMTRFEVSHTSRTEEEISRAIYGFLCFDHQETNFFIEGEEEKDVCAGYIFADILSLYLIDFLNYTFYSDTFKAVLEKVPGLKQELFGEKTR